MKDNLLSRLSLPLPIILDGAMGTFLRQLEQTELSHPEFLNINRPSAILEAHKRYIKAGAKIIFTNTFGANRLRLADSKMSFNLQKINVEGVRLAQKAAGKTKIYIAGNIGPSGLSLSLINNDSITMISDIFKEQALCLAEAGVNFLALETFTTLKEASIALSASKAVTHLPIMLLLSLNSKGQTLDGYILEEAFAELEKGGAASLGLNCGEGATQIKKLLPRLLSITKLPIAIKPSAGLPNLSGAPPPYPETPEFWSLQMAEIATMDVSFLGGCCGTTPQYTAFLCAKIQTSIV